MDTETESCKHVELGFSVFTSRLLATDLNTETSTSDHYEVFLLLRFQSPWNLRTRLKTLSLTHSFSLGLPASKSKLCYDRRSVGQSVFMSSTHLGPTSRFLLLSDICGFVYVRRSFWRENGSTVYNCFWPSSAQSFFGRRPAGLVNITFVAPINLQRGTTVNTSRGPYPLLCDVTAYAEVCLPSRCLESVCIILLFYCYERVLLSNGCSSGSTVLAGSKYATIYTPISTLSRLSVICTKWVQLNHSGKRNFWPSGLLSF
jgi:hypothetical protein